MNGSPALALLASPVLDGLVFACALVALVCSVVAIAVARGRDAVDASGVAAPAAPPAAPPAATHPAAQSAEAVSSARLALLVDHCADVLLLVGRDRTVRFASPALTSVFGYPADLVVGQHICALVTGDQCEVAERRLAAALALPVGESARFEIEILAGDQSIRPAEVVAVRIDETATGDCLVLTMSDIADFRSIQAQLEHQAFHDALTGLPNRSLFLNRVDQSLKRRAQGEFEHVAVMYLDLDGFKGVNDAMGHDAGDELLQAVGYRLVGCLRSGDTVARMGGDEFAVLLADGATIEEARAVAQRILEVLSLPLDVAGEPIAVQASIGLALARSGATTESVLRASDLAMLRAKQQGKARLVIDDE